RQTGPTAAQVSPTGTFPCCKQKWCVPWETSNMANPEPVQPPLSELLERYLKQQTSAQALGLGVSDAAGEVLPFEAASTRPVDPRLAWDGSLAVLRYLQPAFQTNTWASPPEWPSLVATQPSQASVAFCLGNFPQMVHSLQPLLGATDFSSLRP